MGSSGLSLSQGRQEILAIRMSVRIHVNFTVHREEEKFKARALEVVKNSKKSAGCISSGLFKELGGNSFAIIETWESEAACDKDTTSDHVTGFLQEMGDSVTVEVKKFAAL